MYGIPRWVELLVQGLAIGQSVRIPTPVGKAPALRVAKWVMITGKHFGRKYRVLRPPGELVVTRVL